MKTRQSDFVPNDGFVAGDSKGHPFATAVLLQRGAHAGRDLLPRGTSHREIEVRAELGKTGV
jgi:hypothetical protein